MATESQLFAETEPGLPDFYETLDRPQGDLDVHGHDEPLNYRYVGGEVFVRPADLDRAQEILEGDLVPTPAPAPGDGEAPVAPPISGDGTGGGIGIGGAGTLGRRGGRIRLRLREPEAVPDAVDTLGQDIPASPHHVYVLGNHTQFGPAGLPESIAFPGWADDYARDQGRRSRPGVSVAIIDTGFLPKDDTQFPMDRVLDPYDLDAIPANGGIPPYIGHGTFVAGRVMQKSPSARLIMVRPRNMSETENGRSLAVSDDDLAMALARAVAVAAGNDAYPETPEQAAAFASGQFGALARGDADVPSVLNLSLSGTVHSQSALVEFSQMRKLLDVWIALGTKVVASAGNEHSQKEHYPGAFHDVFCVGARGDRGPRADFSNYGPWVDMYAPGVDVESWFIDRTASPWDGFARWSGTSFAAPYISGLIAK